jgi:hypothetical protein
MHVEISIGLELIIAHVEGRNGRMMRNLLNEDRDPSNHTLVGLTEDGIEGLAESRMACENEHEGSCHIFYLL